MSDEVKTDVSPVPFRKKYLKSHRQGKKLLNVMINEAREAKHKGETVDIAYYRMMGFLIRVCLDYFSFAADLKTQEELVELREIVSRIQGEQGDDT